MAKTARKISDFEKIVESKSGPVDEVSIYWFVARGSILKGPFSQNELAEKIRAEEITDYDYAWRQGFHEWRPLGSIPEIKSTPPSSARFEDYPAIPVPGQAQRASSVSRDEEGFPLSPHRKRKDVEVRLRTANKQWISPRQATLFVLFAILVSYVTNLWFQKQVLKNISVFFQSRTAGRSLTLGENSPHAVHPEVWTPLFSAPSFDEVRDNIKLPVRLYGIGHTVANQAFQIENQKIDVSAEWVERETQFPAIDPMYVRPVEIIGKLNPRDPNQVRVKQLGEPFIENIWEK